MNFDPRSFPADTQPFVEEMLAAPIKRVAEWLKTNEHAPLTALIKAYQTLPQLQSLDAGLRQYVFDQAIHLYMEQK